MSSATLRSDSDSLARPDADQKLVVSWQHPTTRAMEAIGMLSFDGSSYRFAYLDRAAHIDGFRPLLGFPEFAARYESKELFPLFAQRAMDPRRPDFERWITELALEGETTPWEQIVRSGGQREGDTIQLFPVPRFVDGVWKCFFLANGMRYMLKKSVEIDGELRGSYSPGAFEELLASLVPGTSLALVPEPKNDWSNLAVLVTTDTHQPVGYVPQLLVNALHSEDARGKVRVEVERLNAADAGWHLRLLVELTGDMDATFDFFDQDVWQRASG